MCISRKTPAGIFDSCAKKLNRADWLFYRATFPDSDINDIFSASAYPNIGNVEYLVYQVTTLRGEGLKIVDKNADGNNHAHGSWWRNWLIRLRGYSSRVENIKGGNNAECNNKMRFSHGNVNKILAG
ncbi:Uncharacterised protein [Klebsiella michiganensis]|uniref:Uncharacterized protein n=1 Tax=Klebsiella michiganensis TaxID=1134687 RepID=A0A7H4MYQ9_9ENTR|nr:Uncharacterised protein [Klebsiella michiganensis]